MTARKSASILEARPALTPSRANRRSRQLIAAGTTRPATKTTPPASPAHTSRCQALTPCVQAATAAAADATTIATMVTGHSDNSVGSAAICHAYPF